MTELFSITITFIFLFLLSLFPMKVNFYQEKSIFYENNIFDVQLLNLIINISIFLFISFTNIDYSIYFISIITISLIINLFWIKDIYKFFKNKNFIFFIISNLIIAVYLISNPILAWDGLENWYFKTQNFFYGYNFFDLKEVIGNNNYYPHLGTFIWGVLWKNSLLQYEYLGRLFFVFIYLLSIFSICQLVKKNNQFKIIILALIILLTFDEFLFRGYQEIFIFSLFIYISKNFYLYLKNKTTVNLIISFICLNLIPWIKHEGFLFTIVFSISMLIIIRNHFKKLDIVYFVLLPFVLLIFKNYMFYKYLDLNFAHGGGVEFFSQSNSFFEFIYVFLKGFIIALIKYKIWILIFISFYFLTKNKFFNSKEILYLKFLKINFFLYLILLLGIYYNLFVNSNIDFNWWIANSLDRLMYSISGLFIIYIIFFTNNLKNYILK